MRMSRETWYEQNGGERKGSKKNRNGEHLEKRQVDRLRHLGFALAVSRAIAWSGSPRVGLSPL